VQAADIELQGTLADWDVNRSPIGARQGQSFQQWVHVAVLEPSIGFLINFSTRHVARDASARRLVALVYTDRVRGCVRQFEGARCRAPIGRADLRFGPNRMTLTGDTYRVELDEPEFGLHADLTLRALAQASTLQNLRLAGGATLGWTVVPRLVASGVVRYGGRTYELRDAPAYRDRNWGSFDFAAVAWDWGYVTVTHPRAPYAVVFARLMDRSRGAVLEQEVLVWRQRELLAAFRDEEVSFRVSGTLTERVETVPVALALCRPGHAADVPKFVAVDVASVRGRLHIEFRRTATARILVPSERGIGTGSIHESLGDYRVRGSVEGHSIGFQARGFLECVHGQRLS
jgi:hypothetical protein